MRVKSRYTADEIAAMDTDDLLHIEARYTLGPRTDALIRYELQCRLSPDIAGIHPDWGGCA